MHKHAAAMKTPSRQGDEITDRSALEISSRLAADIIRSNGPLHRVTDDSETTL